MPSVITIVRQLGTYVSAILLLFQACGLIAAAHGNSHVLDELSFLPVDKVSIDVTKSETSAQWKKILEKDDYQIIVAASSDGHRIALNSSSIKNAQSNVTSLLRRRIKRFAGDECVYERTYKIPFGKFSDERIGSDFIRIIVKQSTSFGLHRHFNVYRNLSTIETDNDSRSDAPSGSQSDLGCFYSGYVFGVRHSSRVLVSVLKDHKIRGLVHINEDTYIIEPYPYLDGGNTRGYHILYAEVKNSSQDVAKRRHRRMTHSTDAEKVNNKVDGTLEVIVVVDKEMIKRHQGNDVTTYTLAIMNAVELNISHHAGESLMKFCRWQASLRGVRHDLAILITGIDICSYKDTPCDTLGFAPIRGMCTAEESCVISEDTGLGTAFTVAHEIGHSFGMFHDSENNNCLPASGNLMAPTLVGHQGTFKWSSCSRKYLAQFLSSPQAWCIVDADLASRSRADKFGKPQSSVSLTLPHDKLPGELYSTVMQCRWQFGSFATTCAFEFAKDVCKSLWCYTGNRKCETKHLPAAEGTSCGVKRWCRKGVCVRHGHSGPAPVHGGWSEFGAWTPCSRTCGGGVTYKERHCNNPRAQYGGSECDGESHIYKLCKTDPCPTDDVEFRAEQCQAFNKKEFRGQFYKWLPFTNITEVSDQCRLFCQPAGHQFFVLLANKVHDGTRCGFAAQDVCIYGVCSRVGCDGLVDSGAELDWCGVCNGDNSSCDGSREIFSPTPMTHISVPGGQGVVSSLNNVTIEAHTLRHTYRWSNGDWLPCSQPCGGGWQKRSRICLFGDRRMTPRYCAHLQRAPAKRRRCNEHLCPTRWHVGHWSECSTTCGLGFRHRQVTCREVTTDVLMPNAVCLQQNSSRPNETVECSSDACYIQTRWVMSSWSSCSKSCGHGTRHRSAICSGKLLNGKWKILSAEDCNTTSRPSNVATEERCRLSACPSATHGRIGRASWFTSAWRKCTATCGAGSLQERLVRCLDDKTGLPSEQCSERDKPAERRSCVLPPCPAPTTSGVPACHDALTWCRHLLTTPGLCVYRYYAKQCCQACLSYSRVW